MVQLYLEIKEQGEMPEGSKRISATKRKSSLEHQQEEEDPVARMGILREGTVERLLQLLRLSPRMMALRGQELFRGLASGLKTRQDPVETILLIELRLPLRRLLQILLQQTVEMRSCSEFLSRYFALNLLMLLINQGACCFDEKSR